MSAKISGQVWDLQLTRMESYILLAMADHADHEGRHVFPSQALIAWKTGYSKRQVQRVQDELKRRKILIPEGTGYRGVQHYRLDFSQVPLKPPFSTSDKMTIDKMSPVKNPHVNALLQTTSDKMSIVEPATDDKMSIDKMSTDDILDTTSDISDTSHNKDARAESSVEPKKIDTPPISPQGEPTPDIPVKRKRPAKTSSEQPQHAPEAFAQFYQAYPKHLNPDDAMKAWDTRKPDDTLQALILENVQARARDDPEWLKDRGKYIPYPATYLRNSRWKDEWKPLPAKRVTRFVE